MCTEYEKQCQHWLSYAECPPSSRVIDSCTDDSDYNTWQGVCLCGNRNDVASDRVAEDIIDAMLRPVYYNLLNVEYIADTSVTHTTQYLREGQQASPHQITKRSSSVPTKLPTVHPTPERPTGPPSLAPTAAPTSGLILPNSVAVVDACSSFTTICDYELEKVACPYTLRVNLGCQSNVLDKFIGRCECGALSDVLSVRTAELVVDATLSQSYFSKYLYIQPAVPPYAAIMGYNSFNPLLLTPQVNPR
jgi:hypothetical protein